MFDMIPILFDSTLMIARPTPLDMDFGLLIRPYRREAWIMVGVTVAAIFAFLIVPGFFLPKFSSYTRYENIWKIHFKILIFSNHFQPVTN